MFDALHAAFSISVSMQMEIHQSETTTNNFIRGDFKFKLQALCLHMMAEMMVILAPFLSFTTSYTPNKTHNMFVLMLDPCFKCLDVVKAFVGWEKVMEMVVEYDTKSLVPLLVATFHLQNLGSIDPIDALVVTNRNSIFGQVTSNGATLQGLLKNEISLFHHLHVKLEHYLLLLTWWKSHELQFPNISFVARKILKILGSQIETKRIFNIVGVLTSLCHCRLGVENLDKFVIIMKNRSSNARVDCMREGKSLAS
jgi:hypothetical protein